MSHPRWECILSPCQSFISICKTNRESGWPPSSSWAWLQSLLRAAGVVLPRAQDPRVGRSLPVGGTLLSSYYQRLSRRHANRREARDKLRCWDNSRMAASVTPTPATSSVDPLRPNPKSHFVVYNPNCKAPWEQRSGA